MEHVSALGELDEFAEQTAFDGSGCIRRRGAKFTAPPGVADNIMRAARHVERATPERPQAKKPPAPTPIATDARKPARLGRPIADYRTLIETCRARATDLELSRSEIDRLGGYPAGYSGKLLGKMSVEDVGFPRKKSSKRLWPIALDIMLGVLGLKIILIEDDAATARTLGARKPVKQNQQRFGNVSRMSARLLPPPCGAERSEGAASIAEPSIGDEKRAPSQLWGV